jgi:general L-amino acid transport system permease protein
MMRADPPRNTSDPHVDELPPTHLGHLSGRAGGGKSRCAAGNALPPPTERIPALRWLKQNLFSSWLNAILTLVASTLIVTVVCGLGRWALTDAQWEVIPANLKLLLVGTYPAGELWRVWAILCFLGLLTGFAAGHRRGLIRRISLVAFAVLIALALLPFPLVTRGWLLGCASAIAAGYGLGQLAKLVREHRWIRRAETALWILSFPVSLIVLNGVGGFLPVIEGRIQWGFMLNLLGAVVGIGLSLPLGVLLALGRRSRLPAIRIACTAYIELIRGVPLISLLFMASIMLQLLLPDSFRPDLVIRAMLTITLFSAAYMAENVRGGLQAIPKGQYEAAYAVGLNGALTTILVILPQALRAVIPAIVGQFIALFKDTTLFGFIAILELLNISRSVLGNLEWRGRIFELYVFIGVVFWVLCYSMSYVSRRIEKSLGVGER